MKDWKLKKNSLLCVAPLILAGVRAKQHWMADGDRNTKFFHQVTNRRRKFNVIHKIKVDDEPFGVKSAIVHFYENFPQEDQPSRPFLDGIPVASISLDEARDLEKVFTEDEIWNAITELGNKKAPA